ncbi:MAG TPA: aminoglycoside phosphotransferase family protein [Steroidobacteraceae bacterium]|nr:aminoglycoside phosphotransferase family protein [Steroidobacteraceae bacterium]
MIRNADTGNPAEVGARTLADATWLLWSPPAKRVVVRETSSIREYRFAHPEGDAADAIDSSLVLRTVPLPADTQGHQWVFVECQLVGDTRARIGALLRLFRTFFGLRWRGYRTQRWLRLRDDDGAIYRADVISGNGWRVGRLARELILAALRGGAIAVGMGAACDCLYGRITRTAALPGDSPDVPLHYGSGRVFRAATESHVIRMPRGASAEERCRTAFDTLSRLASLQLSFGTPRAVRSFVLHGQTVFVESRLPGGEFSYRTLSLEQRAALRHKALAMLAELQRKAALPGGLHPDDLRRLVTMPLESILELPLDERLKARLQSAGERVLHSLRTQGWVATQTHGDYKIANLVASGEGGVTGIVDWDRAMQSAVAGLDAIYYLAFDRALLNLRSMSQAIVDATAHDGALPEVRDYCKTMEIGPDKWLLAGFMTLIQHICGQFHAGAAGAPTWLTSQAEALAGAASLVESLDHTNRQ